MKKEVLSDGAWVVLGQVSSAAGTLVAVRALTEVLEPAVYGSVALITGVVTLALGVSASGTLQAVLRLFPECTQEGRLDLLYGAASRTLTRMTLWFSAALAGACILYSIVTHSNPWAFVLVPGFLAVETLASFQLTLLNAAQQQRLMAVWLGVASWLRALSALAGVKFAGANTEAVLWGYLVGSGLLVGAFSKAARAPFSRKRPDCGSRCFSLRRREDFQALEAEITRYGMPLAFLGLVGWLSGQADRYIIGGLLGLSSAGQYAAIYGLVGRPFLMAGGSIELVLRQIFYESVTECDLRAARRIFMGWLGSVGILAALGVLGFSFFHSRLSFIFLAEPYRENAFVMPWIAIGYALLLFAHVLERVCYATKETGAVLFIQSVGAISSIPISLAGVLWSGIAGAAAAVPCYFGLQVVIALVCACRAARAYSARMTPSPVAACKESSAT